MSARYPHHDAGPTEQRQAAERREVFEHFWPQLVGYTVETAASGESLRDDLHELLLEARACGFVPPRNEGAS